MASDGHGDELAQFEVQMDLAAAEILPWGRETPIESHLNAEGIDS